MSYVATWLERKALDLAIRAEIREAPITVVDIALPAKFCRSFCFVGEQQSIKGHSLKDQELAAVESMLTIAREILAAWCQAWCDT